MGSALFNLHHLWSRAKGLQCNLTRRLVGRQPCQNKVPKHDNHGVPIQLPQVTYLPTYLSQRFQSRVVSSSLRESESHRHRN